MTADIDWEAVAAKEADERLKYCDVGALAAARGAKRLAAFVDGLADDALDAHWCAIDEQRAAHVPALFATDADLRADASRTLAWLRRDAAAARQALRLYARAEKRLFDERTDAHVDIMTWQGGRRALLLLLRCAALRCRVFCQQFLLSVLRALFLHRLIRGTTRHTPIQIPTTTSTTTDLSKQCSRTTKSNPKPQFGC